MISVTVIMTCHNRRDNSRRCIQSIFNTSIDMQFIVVDDGSTDGTKEMLSQLKEIYNISVINGDGNLYWAGGMRLAMEVASKIHNSDYFLLVNDDVVFYSNALSNALNDINIHYNAVIAGVTEDDQGNFTYGGIKYTGAGICYENVGLSSECDTFNCNFVLIPSCIFLKNFSFDRHFTHSMADFDYGLCLKKSGILLLTSAHTVGVCYKNNSKGTWQDVSLGIWHRIKLKESPKGLPVYEWYYFLKKHFGLRTALIRSITPYIKIILIK